MSLARQHFIRTMAAAASTAPDTASVPARSVRHRMEARLALHQQQLKQMQSIQRRIETKRDYLPDYGDYVRGVLDADAGGQDQVIVTVMVWRADVGDYQGALDIAAYALRHHLVLPERFARGLATWLVEELAEAALKAPEAVGPLCQAMDLTASADMPDEVRAKGQKALGLAQRETDPDAALACFETALALNKNCGVKNEIARLRRAPATGEPAVPTAEA